MYVLMLSLKTRKKIPARKCDYYTRMLAIINSKPIERILPLKGGGGGGGGGCGWVVIKRNKKKYLK